MTFVIAWIGLVALVLFFQPWRPHVTPSTMKPHVKTWGFPFIEKGKECESTSHRGSNDSGWR